MVWGIAALLGKCRVPLPILNVDYGAPFYEELMLEGREEDALKMNESSSITLLQLVQEVAYCDGSMSEEEEELILSLIDSHGLQEDRDALKNRLVEGYSSPSRKISVARGSTQRIEHDDLFKRLSALKSKEERDLAVKLAYLTAMVSRDQNDLTDINAQELALFERSLRPFITQKNGFGLFSGRQMKSCSNGAFLL